MNHEVQPNSNKPGGEDPQAKYLKEQAERVDEILEQYGDIRIKNPHFGLPGHEDDDEIMVVSETPDSCPQFMVTLLRAETEEKLAEIIDIYKAG